MNQACSFLLWSIFILSIIESIQSLILDIHCQTCLQTCKTCIGWHVCSECLTEKYYFKDNECDFCPAQCATCTSSSTCQTCVATYYLSAASCLPCSTGCQTCSSSSSCDTCIDTYLLSSSICLPCTKPCANCSGSVTTCSTCIDTNQTPTLCNCNAGYLMDAATKMCNQCTFPCGSCDISLPHCTSCASTYHYDSTAHTCVCLSDEFESIGAPNSCIACDSICLTCSSSSTNCDICKSGLNRHIDNHQCLCDNGYYLDITDCALCLLPCSTCITSATDCSSCNGSNQSLPSCNCNNTFYMDTSHFCQQCASPCLNCNSNATTCTSCIDTYYLSGSSCLNCSLPCQKCVDNALKCTSCMNPYQSVSNDTCVCDDGKQMDSSYFCQWCNYPCSTCVDTPDKCLSCAATYTMSTSTPNTCECPSGFYQDVSNTPKDCQACTSPCQTCSGSTNQCSSCVDAHQTLNMSNQCPCNSGWIVNGTLCDQCLNPCTICSGTTSYCTVCKDTHHHLNTGQCICDDGWLNDSNYDCQQCISPCKTCISSITHCVTCTHINHIINSSFECICKDKYYSNSASTCAACTEPCNNCDINGCLTCIDANQIIASINLECKCKNGYFMVGVNCSQCQSPCATCFSTQDHCLSCIDINQIIISDQCVCKDGYYSEDDHCDICQSTCVKCIGLDNCSECVDGYYLDTTTCLKCDKKCSSCNDSSTCITCAESYFVNGENDCIQCTNLCKECTDSFSCNSCLIGSYQFKEYCLECSSNCLTCITSKENCVSCRQNYQLNGGKCECKAGYFQEANSCLNCSYPCLDCENLNICLQCVSISYLILTNEKKCKCEDGYFWEKNACTQCDSQCQTCSTKNVCVSCNKSANRILTSNKCQCFDNYFEDNNNICIPCHSDLGKVTKSCQYKDCSDSIWTYGEKCDDGNTIVGDGCSYCQIDPNYFCENSILEQSICFQCPSNCEKCKLNSDSKTIDCITCSDGYYVEQLQCVKCSDKCLGCKNSSSNCIQCRFYKNSQSGECQFCESEQGYYSDFTNNNCYSKCSDSFKASDEECDDGNLLNGDGCDKYCKLEKNFLCKDGICIAPSYPIPTLSQSGEQPTYNNLRQFQFGYDKKLNLSEFFNLTEQVQLDIIQNEIQSSIYYSCSISQQLQKDQNNFITLSALINITLNQTLQDGILVMKFKNRSLILSYEGYSQQELNVTSIINNYIQIDQGTVTQVQAATSSNMYMLYVVGAMAGGALIFGGVDIFYNLLDTIQMLSYLKYINADMPYNLLQFFNFFGFAQLNFISRFFNLKGYIDSYINYSKLGNIPSKIEDDDLNSLFIINGTSILVVWISLLGIYLVATLLPRLLNSPKYYSEIYYHDVWLRRLKLYYQVGRIFLKKICYVIVTEFFFSGILRVYIATAYDYTFSMLLQIAALQLQSKDFLVRLSSSLSLVALVVYLLMIYFIINISNLSKYVQQSEELSKQYGSIFEGIRKNHFSQYYNAFLLIKKLLFMTVLILIYSFPLYQIINLTLFSVLQTIFLSIFKPFENSYEYYKQLISEISISLTLFLLMTLVVDEQLIYFSYNRRQQIGWGCIICISFILVMQIIIDAIQQWQLLVRKFKQLKFLVDKISNYFQSSVKKEINHNVFVQV